MTTASDRSRIREGLAAVRDCVGTMEEQAAHLLESLPNVHMDAALRSGAAELFAGLQDTAGRVSFEVAMLATEAGTPEADTANIVQRLIDLDATMMSALAPVAELADQLERAAERDEANERAYVLVVEAAGVLLQALEQARSATAALRA